MEFRIKFVLGFGIILKDSWLIIMPIPFVGFCIAMPQRRVYLYSTRINEVVGSTTPDQFEYENRTNGNSYKAIPYWAKHNSSQPLFGKSLTGEEDDD